MQFLRLHVSLQYCTWNLCHLQQIPRSCQGSVPLGPVHAGFGDPRKAPTPNTAESVAQIFCGRQVHKVVTDSRKQSRHLQRAARGFPSPASSCRQPEEHSVLPWISCENSHLWYTQNGTCLLQMKRANTDVRSLEIPVPQNASSSPGNIVYVKQLHSFKVLFF